MRRGIALGLATVLVLALAAIALATAGSFDSSFGTGGQVSTDFGEWSYAHDVVIQPDGRVVAAGEAGIEFALARYHADGALDASFGGDGKVTTDFTPAGSDHYSARASAVVRQSDGKLVAVGTRTYSSPGSGEPGFDILLTDIVLARYKTDGSLDSAFGGGGTVLLNVKDLDYGHDVVIQPDGKIVVVGSAGYQPPFNVGDDSILLARLNSDGTLDAGIGTSGKVLTDVGSRSEGYELVVEPDGDLVVLARVDWADFRLLRYLPNGALDAGFGSGGVAATPFGLGDWAAALRLLPDGKFLVGGARSHVLALSRHKADGTTDTGFGSGGLATIDPGADFTAGDMAVGADGKAVVVGYTLDAQVLGRFTADGSTDHSFGAGGVKTIAYARLPYYNAVTVQADGRIVVAGSLWNDVSGRYDMLVARFHGDGIAPVTVASLRAYPARPQPGLPAGLRLGPS